MTDGHSIYLYICVGDFCLSFPLFVGLLTLPLSLWRTRVLHPWNGVDSDGCCFRSLPLPSFPGWDAVMAGDGWYGCRGVL